MSNKIFLTGFFFAIHLVQAMETNIEYQEEPMPKPFKTAPLSRVAITDNWAFGLIESSEESLCPHVIEKFGTYLDNDASVQEQWRIKSYKPLDLLVSSNGKVFAWPISLPYKKSGVISCFNEKDKKKYYAHYMDKLGALALNNTGEKIAYGSNNTITISNSKDLKDQRNISINQTVKNLTFDEKSEFVVAALEKKILLWNCLDQLNTQNFIFIDEAQSIPFATLNKDKICAVVNKVSNFAPTHFLEIFDKETSFPIITFENLNDEYKKATFFEDELLAACDNNGEVLLYDLRTNKLVMNANFNEGKNALSYAIKFKNWIFRELDYAAVNGCACSNVAAKLDFRKLNDVQQKSSCIIS